jgi:uncharacterized protein
MDKEVRIIKRQQYEDLEKFMLFCMKDSVHDKLHVYRVVNYAAQIADETENADFDVVITASLLHDIGRVDEFENPSISHAETGSRKARDFLLSSGYSLSFSEKIELCILSHRHKKGAVPESLEAKILYDADKLDLIGCVGTARAILFGGQIDEPLYVLDASGQPTYGYPEEVPSLFREYHRKLQNLSSMLYTDAGIRIALSQQQMMNQYFEGLIDEVNQNHINGNRIINRKLE